MEWIINQLRERPELAIFLTLFLGFWLGKLRIGKSLGDGHKRIACRRIGRTVEDRRTRPHQIRVLSSLFVRRRV